MALCCRCGYVIGENAQYTYEKKKYCRTCYLEISDEKPDTIRDITHEKPDTMWEYPEYYYKGDR